MLGEAHPRLAALLNEIRFVNTTTVSMAYLFDDIPAERPLDGFGVLIPASEQRRLIAVTWASTKFRHRAPAGCVLMRAFVGGYRDEALAALPEEELLQLIRQEYESLFGITQAPMFHRIYRWPQANPQYDVGHLQRIAEIEREAAEWPGTRAGRQFLPRRRHAGLHPQRAPGRGTHPGPAVGRSSGLV
jgi:oxygen-dependent protoporphyrinogen oxidase